MDFEGEVQESFPQWDCWVLPVWRGPGRGWRGVLHMSNRVGGKRTKIKVSGEMSTLRMFRTVLDFGMSVGETEQAGTIQLMRPAESIS